MSKKAEPTTTPEPFRAIVSADYFRRAWEATSKEDSRYYLQGVYLTPDPRGGAIIVATDGHMLICIRDPKAFIRGSAIVNLNRSMIAALRSRTPSGFIANTGPYLLVEESADKTEARAYVAHNDVSLAGRATTIAPSPTPHASLLSIFDRMDGRVVCFQGYRVLIDGNYPDFRRVVPKDLKGSTLAPTISAKVMGQLYSALTTGPKAKPMGHLTFYQVPHPEGNNNFDQPYYHPVMAIPGDLNGEPFEAFGVAMPMRPDHKGKAAPPAWWQSFAAPETELADLKPVEAKLTAAATTIADDAKAATGGPFPRPGQTGYCHADRDGDCRAKWGDHECPQLRDGEPAATGRHCPDDNRPPED